MLEALSGRNNLQTGLLMQAFMKDNARDHGGVEVMTKKMHSVAHGGEVGLDDSEACSQRLCCSSYHMHN